jgi:hypothetical protein
MAVRRLAQVRITSPAAPRLRRRGLLALGTALLAGVTAGAQAQPAYPVKPVTLVVAFAPGGPNDVMARILAAKLSANLGQQFIVENKAGAGGTIGTAQVAKAPADGYTLLFNSAPFVTAPARRRTSQPSSPRSPSAGGRSSRRAASGRIERCIGGLVEAERRLRQAWAGTVLSGESCWTLAVSWTGPPLLRHSCEGTALSGEGGVCVSSAKAPRTPLRHSREGGNPGGPQAGQRQSGWHGTVPEVGKPASSLALWRGAAWVPAFAGMTG